MDTQIGQEILLQGYLKEDISQRVGRAVSIGTLRSSTALNTAS
jgi:hypothetical protein